MKKDPALGATSQNRDTCEICERCGSQTQIFKSEHLENGMLSNDGHGRLCVNCYNQIDNEADDHYVPGEKFDYTVKHSDAFYSEYIDHFESSNKPHLFYRICKRSLDLIVSLIMLIVLLPVFIIIAIAIKCDSKGPIVFKQKRVGRYGKHFICYKFRTMKIEAPENRATSLLEHPEQYYTRVGRFLRKFSLDELPQLWCVLIGKMSIIGYRPLIVSEKNCNDMREKLGVFRSRPGISGYAQVYGRDIIYYKNKAIMDAEYASKTSLLLDIKLMFLTVWVVISKKGYRS